MKLSRRGLLAGVLGLPIVGLLGKGKAEPYSNWFLYRPGAIDADRIRRVTGFKGRVIHTGANYSDTRARPLHLLFKDGTDPFEVYKGRIKPYIPASLNHRGPT